MLDGIKQIAQDYYDQIPNNTLRTIGKSAFFSFCASVFIEGTGINKTLTMSLYDRPLMAAGLAAVAAFVHALLTPIFNALFENKREVRFLQEVIKHAIEVSIMRLCVYNVTAQKVNLLGENGFDFTSVNLLKSMCHIGPDFISLFDPITSLKISQFLDQWGINTPDGENTTFIVH